MVALEGFVLSLIPLAIARLSRVRVPRVLEFAFVLGITLQFMSESTKLFEVLYYWDKVVHPTLVALTGMVAAWLLIGYRDAFGKRMPIHLVAAFGMLLGIAVGAVWEFVEFASDWFGNADLQKSNGDTITDIISNDTGAFVATLLALYLYTHFFSEQQRRDTGLVARWLSHGPLMLVRRYGRIARRSGYGGVRERHLHGAVDRPRHAGPRERPGGWHVPELAVRRRGATGQRAGAER